MNSSTHKLQQINKGTTHPLYIVISKVDKLFNKPYEINYNKVYK